MKFLHLFLFLCTINFVNAQSNTNILTVYFDYDSHTLSPSELAKLKVLYTDASITGPFSIEAHTDSSGTVSYNNRLAQKRLNFVMNHIDLSPVTTKIIGEEISSSSLNYVDSKFRKVDISYFISPPPADIQDHVDEDPIEDPIGEPTDEPSLESGMEEFVNSNESTISFDLKIHFNPGTAVPLVESYAELDRLVKIMQENKTLDAFLHGHVCCSDNLDISERRAGFVYNYLVKNGVRSQRLRMKGHSNWEPKTDPELTEEDRISNRRVNVVFTKK